MRTPAQFEALIVTDQNGREWYGITYSKERGFFEPITNGTCESVNIKVQAWRYDQTQTAREVI